MNQYLVVFSEGKTGAWNYSPFTVSTDPEFRMDLVLGDEFTPEDVAHEEVVVHGVCDDLGDRRGVEFDVAKVF